VKFICLDAHYFKDFVFLSDWTEVADWQAYCQAQQIEVLPNLAALLN